MLETDPALRDALCDLARRLLHEAHEGLVEVDGSALSEYNAGQVLGMQRAGARLLAILVAFELAVLTDHVTLDFRSNFGR